MAEYRIPLTPSPQTFTVALAGVEYQLTVRWNHADEAGWVLDIDLPDGAGNVVDGIPLVTGVDLLAPFAHLGIGGSLVVWSEDSDLPPAEDNLGDGVDLFFVTPDAEAAS